jgi:hypothetical protein
MLQLPDLRGQLVYYGANLRPDAASDQALLFGIKDHQESAAVHVGEKLYLKPHLNGQRTTYVWSKTPTPLWIEPIRSEGKQVTLRVALEDNLGNRIATPAERAQIDVAMSEGKSQPNWTIGAHRADTNLLVRQKARWQGRDLFLETHGGAAYKPLHGKQRVDFEAGSPEAYSCYVGQDDLLTWQDNRWQVTSPPETMGRPLLILNSIDERTLHFSLWDPQGTAKTDLNLNQAPAPGAHRGPLNLRFVGMDTWNRFLVDMDGKRTLLHTKDWLMRTPQGWKKIMTAKEVDSYVQGKLVGELLVLDGVEKTSQGTILKGHLFNAQRNAVEQIELPLQQKAIVTSSLKQRPGKPAEAKPPENKTAEEPSTEEVARRLEQLSGGRGP